MYSSVLCRRTLVKLLDEKFGIIPSSDENEIAQQTIEATSTFESQSLTRVRWQDLDHEIIRQLIANAEDQNPGEDVFFRRARHSGCGSSAQPAAEEDGRPACRR
jgi:predicted HTH transcriptional regulator